MKRHVITATEFSRKVEIYSAAGAGRGTGVETAVDTGPPPDGEVIPFKNCLSGFDKLSRGKTNPPFDYEATAEPFSCEIFFLAKQVSPVPNWQTHANFLISCYGCCLLRSLCRGG